MVQVYEQQLEWTVWSLDFKVKFGGVLPTNLRGDFNLLVGRVVELTSGLPNAVDLLVL